MTEKPADVSGVRGLRGGVYMRGSVWPYSGIPSPPARGVPDAVYAASTAPALAVGLDDTGSIEAGKCADLVILDKDLNLVAVFVDGEKVVG